MLKFHKRLYYKEHHCEQKKCGIKEEFNQNGSLIILIYKAISLFFAVITHQYIDIHHTMKQAVNIFSSCSFLYLKTLFHFIRSVFQYHILKARKGAGQLCFYICIAKKQTIL